MLRIPRFPTLFWIAISGVVLAHLVLCHPAATCRGHPPLRADELLMMFVAPFFMGIPALFDDRPAQRKRGVIVASLGMAIIYGIVNTNLNSARPHIGHLAGMIGVIRYHWFGIPFRAVIPFFVLWFSLTFYERVAGDFWALLRGFLPKDVP